MFRFEDISYLYLLGIVPLLVLIYILYIMWVKRDRSKLSEDKLFTQLAPGFSWARKYLKFALLLISLAFLFVGWANPQWGNKKEKVKAKSSDIFLALDISQSMMAEDISPNRLERAKRLAINIVKSLKGNRIGLILFAGNAYLQMPLSNDFAAAEIFIQSANTDQAGTQGTAITEAIDLAQRAFQDDVQYQRALIIVTDGENHDEEAIAKAEEARDDGLVIFSVGVGTEEGGYVPYEERGREQYKKDKDGVAIKSKLNLNLLRDLADAGNGKYYLIQQGDKVITELKSEIERIEKQEVEQRSFTEYTSYFQYFLGFGLLLMLIEYLINNNSSGKVRKSIIDI